MSVATNPYGYKYWEYIIVNYDDLLVIYHCSNLVMKGFDTSYTLNTDANGKKWSEKTAYLGSGIAKFQVPDTGETYWSISGEIK